MLPWLSELSASEESDLEDSFLVDAVENIEQNLWTSEIDDDDDDDDILISAAKQLDTEHEKKKIWCVT